MRAEYGLGLRDVPILELADLVAWLPAGCALWRAIGGPMSITNELRALRIIEFRLRVLDWHLIEGKGDRPEPPEEPKYVDETPTARMSRKAEMFMRRQQASGGRR